jgi:hypothetical protein
MREINLRKPSRTVVGYSTAMEAIRANQVSPRSMQAQEFSQKIADKLIEGGCWADDKCAILLSDDCAICFSSANEEVMWELISRPQFDVLHSSYGADPEPIRVRRQAVDGRILTSQMDRTAIMSRMVGKRVRRIVTDEFGVYVYFESDRSYVSFHGSVIADVECPFLEWFEGHD